LGEIVEVVDVVGEDFREGYPKDVAIDSKDVWFLRVERFNSLYVIEALGFRRRVMNLLIACVP